MRRVGPVVLVSLVALAAACSSNGGGGGGGDDDGGGAPDASDTPTPDAGVDADGYLELSGADFTIAPNDEPYRCARLTVTEDVYVTSFRDQSPAGTHHTVLSVGAPSGADGEYDCNVGANKSQQLFASGIGTDDFSFPANVAIKIAAGQQLQINLHLYNVGPTPLSGRGATLVKTISAAEAAGFDLAEMFFAGPTLGISIPSNGTAHTETGTCGITDAGTIIDYWPHMHQLGTRMRILHNGALVHDQPYSFTEQTNWPTTRAIAAGDVLTIECTYVNSTGATVGFGDSSEAEMCFAGFYRYPAVGAAQICDAL